MEQFLPQIIEAYGPSAITILALVYWGWAERKARIASEEKRIDEVKLHSRELFETIHTIKDLRVRIEERR